MVAWSLVDGITISEERLSLVCFAFDCDGTLETSNGPVPIRFLEELMDSGHDVFIVSPSVYCVGLRHIPHFTLLAHRAKVLMDLMGRVESDRYIYVGDSQADLQSAEAAGWEFISAHGFVAWLG